MGPGLFCRGGVHPALVPTATTHVDRPRLSERTHSPTRESPLTTRYIYDTIPLSLTSGEERHCLVRRFSPAIALFPPFPLQPQTRLTHLRNFSKIDSP